MSTCNQIEKIKPGKYSVNGKTVYAAEFSSREGALRWAYNYGDNKELPVSHPAIKGFLVVRPVDADRIFKAGGALVR
jgi:hypothetical protein